jgi:hypothetical protein
VITATKPPSVPKPVPKCDHIPFNLMSECNPGYAKKGNLLHNIGCDSCPLAQIEPHSSKPVWLCPELNKRSSSCTFALCNDCYQIKNADSARTGRKRKPKTY